MKEQVDASFRHMTQQMTEEEQAEFQRLLMLAAEASLDLEERASRRWRGIRLTAVGFLYDHARSAAGRRSFLEAAEH